MVLEAVQGIIATGKPDFFIVYTQYMFCGITLPISICHEENIVPRLSCNFGFTLVALLAFLISGWTQGTENLPTMEVRSW